jgi:lipopolysaccharide/colanic/teichoic acid biosynthesis glycosyltransferase
MLGEPLLPRFVLAMSSVLLVGLGLWSWRLWWRGSESQTGAERVLAVVDERLRDALIRDVEQAERPVRIVAAPSPERALRPGAVVALAERSHASLVVLGPGAGQAEQIIRQCSVLHRCGVRVRSLETFYDDWLGRTPLWTLTPLSLLADTEIHRSTYAHFKRLADVAVALLGLLGLLVVLPLVTVADLCGNRGPLFFRQQRIGKDGEPFVLVKFRTMPSDVDHASWTERDDKRLNGVGRLLRRSHLDELPQVWNVLRGEMSIVGPRPEQPAQAAELGKHLAAYDARHLLRPGLTGWAQVKAPYASSIADSATKLEYDLWYLAHADLALDLRIVGRTLRSVVRQQGR